MGRLNNNNGVGCAKTKATPPWPQVTTALVPSQVITKGAAPKNLCIGPLSPFYGLSPVRTYIYSNQGNTTRNVN